MKLLRHYFIGDSLDDMEILEEQLEKAGVSKLQIHVLSRQDADVEQHKHLHEVQSLMKNDVVHSSIRGAAVGVGISVLVMFAAYSFGWTETPAGWIPFIFLSVVLLGFCTWEGGLFGIQRPNRRFRQFEQALNDGKHVFFVDLEPAQEVTLENVLKKNPHPRIKPAGTGAANPHWLVALQRKVGTVRHS